MLNAGLAHCLEDIAVELRKVLEIDDGRILNPSDFKEVSSKIQRDERYKIVDSLLGGEAYMTLEDEEHFTFYLFGRKKDNFYDLIEMYAYSIILDKKSLTPNELKHKVFGFPRSYNDSKESKYLMRAFMLPAQTFKSTVIKYESSPGKCDVERMQNELDNKYCYKRGQDLHFWIP